MPAPTSTPSAPSCTSWSAASEPSTATTPSSCSTRWRAANGFRFETWCPTCQETQKNLEADPAAIPAGLTIVKVDFDTSDELKRQYGVTTQHTFVQVDADGNELAKWTGSSTAEDIAGQTA